MLFRLFSLLMVAALPSLFSCSDDPMPEPERENAEARAPAPATSAPPVDSANGGAANAPLCAAISAQCAYTYIWPLEAGPSQLCYCECTKHSDCVAMPNGKTACGTALAIDANGKLTPVFPGGWPLVCVAP